MRLRYALTTNPASLIVAMLARLFNNSGDLFPKALNAIGKALTGPFKGYWRYVIYGDWRAIVKIERKVLMIYVFDIAARDKIYK